MVNLAKDVLDRLIRQVSRHLPEEELSWHLKRGKARCAAATVTIEDAVEEDVIINSSR